MVLENHKSSCVSNTTNPSYHLTKEAHNFCVTVNSCFSSSSATSHLDKWVQWNSSNHNCVILNVDDNCLCNSFKARLEAYFGSWISNLSTYIAGAIKVLLVELHIIHQFNFPKFRLYLFKGIFYQRKNPAEKHLSHL